MLAAPTSPVLKEGLDRTARRLRDQVESVFAAELRGSDRQERLAALDVATSFDTWEHLRTTQGLPVGAARRVVALLVRSLLS